MEPNEALLASVESILDDEELDDAGRNAALAETVKQYIDFTSEAKAVFIKLRDEPDAEGKAGFGASNEGARARLRMLVEHERRSRPGLSEAEAIAAGWRSLSYKDRNSLLAEDTGQEDPAFDYGAIDKRVARTAAIARVNYAFHAVNEIGKRLREEDKSMTLEQARVKARLLNPEWARKEREARLEAR